MLFINEHHKGEFINRHTQITYSVHKIVGYAKVQYMY